MSRVVCGCHSHDYADDGKDFDVAWLYQKPGPTCWVDELFSEEELGGFFERCDALLRERGCRPSPHQDGASSQRGVEVRHPDWPLTLSISAEATNELAQHRYQLVVLIVRLQDLSGTRTVVGATAGPDTPVTPEYLMRRLEDTFFLPTRGN